MADIANVEKNRFVQEGPDGTDMIVRPDGTIIARNLAHDMNENLKLYCFSENLNLASSGTQAPMFLIRNPSGSGKIVRLTDLYAMMTNTVGAIAIIRMYYGPTITTNGTAITIRNRNIGGGAAASALNIYSAPTISANGTRIFAGTMITGTSGGRDLIKPFDGSVILKPNNDLLITGQPDGTNRAVELTLAWAEAS